MSKTTKYFHAYDKEGPPTDPRSDLEEYVSNRAKSLELYAQKPNRNEQYLQRQYAELQQLNAILGKFQGQKLFHVWNEIEAEMEQARDGHDGIYIEIPFVENPRPDRLYRVDYSKTRTT